MGTLQNFNGCRLDSVDTGQDPRICINVDLRRFGELRRRRGLEDRRDTTGTTAVQVQFGGRAFLVTFNTNTLEATRLE